MKKFLLGTTALISMSAATAALAGGSHAPAAAAPANTGGLTVMVGGNLSFQYVSKTEEAEGLGGTSTVNGRSDIFRNDTELNFTASGSTDSFDYGAVIELVGDLSRNNGIGAGSTGGDKNGDTGGTKTYLYIENDSFGRFEGGQNVGASSTLEVDASTIARATGGVDGDGLYNIDSTPFAQSYITAPNLPTGDEESTDGNSNKVTYYTPRFSGLQFGASFSPDSGDRGSASSTTTDTNAGDYSNVFAGGLNFQSDIADGVGIMASAVGETGDAEDNAGTATDENDLMAYSLGLGFEFEGFSVAGNWADIGDSGLDTTPVAAASDSQSYWSAGAAYENGPYGVSVTYFESTQSNQAAASATDSGENDFSNIVVGADYQMAPGLVPFVEASFAQFDSGDTTVADTDATTVLVGANLSF